MAPLELKRKKVELLHVTANRAQMEFRIEELKEEIERVQKHIDVSIAKEQELKDLITAETKAEG